MLHCFVSKHYALGYIGWIAQSPTGIRAGLAVRHDATNARAPHLEGFLRRVGRTGRPAASPEAWSYPRRPVPVMPEQVAVHVAPRFRTKRAPRWAYDRLQFDRRFDLLPYPPPLRWAAEQVYFHKRRICAPPPCAARRQNR